MSRMVFCSRLKKEAEGFEKAPFPGKIGEEIFARVSIEAWEAWKDMQVKIINEYRLDLSEAKARQMLMEQMRNFLGLNEGKEENILHVGTPTYDETNKS